MPGSQRLLAVLGSDNHFCGSDQKYLSGETDGLFHSNIDICKSGFSYKFVLVLGLGFFSQILEIQKDCCAKKKCLSSVLGAFGTEYFTVHLSPSTYHW